MKRRWQAWGCVNDRLNDHFAETFRTRAKMIEYATYRCIGSAEYNRAGTDAKRWGIAYRRGWRLVRVHVSALALTSNKG